MSRSLPHTPPAANSDQAELPLEIHLHLAEYDALTMRITYWLTIQYVIYGLGGAYLAFAAQSHLDLVTLIWATVLAFLSLCWASGLTYGEICYNVLYIEKELKPRIRRFSSTGSFWDYERFLEDRTTGGFSNYERRYAVLVLFLIGAFFAAFPAIPIIWRSSFKPWWKLGWPVVIGYVAVMVILKAYNLLFVLRKEIVHLTCPPKTVPV